MKIKNLTSKTQELTITEIVGGREFTIYLEANSSTEITGAHILHPEKLKGIIEIERGFAPKIEETPIDVEVTQETETPGQPTEESKDEEEQSEETHSREAETLEDKFICDECKAEFSSARALASHKTRAHSSDK